MAHGRGRARRRARPARAARVPQRPGRARDRRRRARHGRRARARVVGCPQPRCSRATSWRYSIWRRPAPARASSPSRQTTCGRRSAWRSRRCCPRRSRSISSDRLSGACPIVPAIDGDPAPGFVVGRVSAEPPTVEIVGPENRVEADRRRQNGAGQHRGRAPARARYGERRRHRFGRAAHPTADRDRHRRDLAGAGGKTDRERGGLAPAPRIGAPGRRGAVERHRDDPGRARAARRAEERISPGVRGPCRSGSRPVQSSGSGGSDGVLRGDGHRSCSRQCDESGNPSMSSRLFGTDGVRGKAGTSPLDHATVARLGAALVRALPQQPAAALSGRPRHARIRRLDRARARRAAFTAKGPRSRARASSPRRPSPTSPGAMQFDAGRRHLRLAQSVRGQRHQGVLGPRREVHRSARARRSRRSWPIRPGPFAGDGGLPPVDRTDVIDAYLEHARSRFRLPSASAASGSRSTRANGATTTVAPRLFTGLGFDVTLIGDEPDGRNINLDCGSTHPERLAALVREGGFRDGRRVRRRRRPRDLRRSPRPDRRRRRRAADVRAAAAARGPAPGRRRSSPP